MPIVGLRTSAPDTAYVGTDVLYINTGFSTTAVQRTMADYWCTATNKKNTDAQAGWVPQGTTWGYDIKGPSYLGIGPPVELSGLPSGEPGLGSTAAWSGTLTVRGLTPGRTYKLHKLTSLATVPTSAAGAVSGTPLLSFVASGTESVHSVTFQSGTPAYFICLLVA